jgi:Carboxypeptidase regulatory-like domain
MISGLPLSGAYLSDNATGETGACATFGRSIKEDAESRRGCVPHRFLRSVVHCSLLPAVLTSGSTALAAAQGTTTVVEGRVVAVGGAAITGARIELKSSETGRTREALVDSAGGYRILAIPPGVYDITCSAERHRAQRRSAVQLVLGEPMRIDWVLETSNASVELAPTIIAAPALTEVDRTNVSTPVLEKEIEQLPLNSRDVLALASIAPGVRSFGQEAGRAIPAAGAISTARFVNLYVDGVEWKGLATGQLVGQPQTGSLIPQEAVREYRVYLNPYDAEYTHGGSWVVSAVTHEGGNTLQGSLFGFEQDRSLVARGSFQTENPRYQRSQIGGNLRGPLRRDRLFFSISYEGQITDNFVTVVPGRPLYAPEIWNRYAGTFRAPFRNEMGMARVTQLLGSHTVDAIWLGRSLTSSSSFGVRLPGGQMLARDAGIVSNYGVSMVQLRDRSVSPSFVNELSLHLLNNSQDDEPLVPGVTLRYKGLQTGRAGFPQILRGTYFGAAEKLSYTTRRLGGEHVLTGGVEATGVNGRSYVPSSRDGLFVFDTDTSTLPRNGTIGVGFEDPRSTTDARIAASYWFAGAFLQDRWRPVPSVTLTLGVRYDADVNTLAQASSSPWATDTTLQRVAGARYLNSGDRKNDLDNFAPRVAMTWDVSGSERTWLRAGYGLMYDRVPAFGATMEQLSWRWRTYTFSNPGTTDPGVLRSRVVAGGVTPTPANVQLLPDHMETPATHQWSLGVGRHLGDHLALNVDYVDQHMSGLPVTVNVNALNATTNRRPLTNRFGDIILWGSFGDATYRGVLTSIVYDRGATRMSAAYTLAWARSEFGAVSTSDYSDSAAYRMQRSDGDERHRLVLSALTTGPLGLQLSTIAILASPRPFAALSGTDVNLSGSADDDWPNGVRTWRRAGLEHWYRTIDVRIGKAVPLSSGRLIVTCDVFNLANWANHSEYQGTLNQLDFGEAVGDYARRQAQIGVRYAF